MLLLNILGHKHASTTRDAMHTLYHTSFSTYMLYAFDKLAAAAGLCGDSNSTDF